MSGLAVLAAQRTYESSDPPGWFFGGLFVIWGVMMLVALAGYVFGIWSLVEILRYREDEFDAVGKNRTTWLVLQIVGLLVCQVMGAVVGILFLWKHRPELRAWRESHPVQPWYLPYPPSAPVPPPGFGPVPGYGAPIGYGAPPPPPPVASSDQPVWPAPPSEWQRPPGWGSEPGAPSNPDRPPPDEQTATGSSEGPDNPR